MVKAGLGTAPQKSLFRKGRGLHLFRNRLLVRNHAKRPRICNRLHPQEKWI